MTTWSAERRAAQRERARRLYEEGRFGGPGRGQGRKPKQRRLNLTTSCPHCGGSLEGVNLDARGADVNRSFVTRRAESGELEFVYLDDEDMGFADVDLSTDAETLRKGGSVRVAGQRGTITGFSRDRDSVYVRFDQGSRKVPVDEVTPVK